MKPLPCASWLKWQSAHCMPRSAWMSIMWTARPGLVPAGAKRASPPRREGAGAPGGGMWPAAGIGAGGDEQAFALEAEGVGVAGRDDVAVGVEQIAGAVAAEDGAKVPAMTVIVGELGCAGERVHPVVDLAQEIQIGPEAARGGAFGIALEHFVDLGGGRVMLVAEARFLLGVAGGEPVLEARPHQIGVGFIIPHRVAEERVQEDVGLVHVAGHALGGRDGAGEDVPDRVAALADAFMVVVGRRLARALAQGGDGGIDGGGLAVAAEARIGQRMAGLPGVGIDDVAAGAAGGAGGGPLVVWCPRPQAKGGCKSAFGG